MKQSIYSSIWLKLAAFLMAAVLLGFGLMYSVIAVNCGNLGFYSGDGVPVFQTTWHCAEAVRDEGRSIIDQYRRNPDFQFWDRLLGDSDLRFIILEEDTGDVVASYLEGLDIDAPANLKNNKFLYQHDYVMSRGDYGTCLEKVYVCDYYFGDNWMAEQSWQENVEGSSNTYEMPDGVVMETPISIQPEAAAEETEISYQILYLLGERLHGREDNIGTSYKAFRYFQYMAEPALIRLAICVCGFLLLVLFLLVQAGRRPHTVELQTTWFDRIPADLLILVGAVAALGCLGLLVVQVDVADDLYLDLKELGMVQGLTSVGAAACGMILVWIMCSFSVRLKQGTFLQSMLVIRVVRWCWRTIRRAVVWVWKKAELTVRSIGMVPRAVLAFLAVAFVEFLLLTWLVNVWDLVLPLMALFVFNCGLLAALIWGAAQMKILQNAAKSLAEGDLEQRPELGRMYWEFKRHGEYLNAIAGGMNKAVEQRMRSERLKTELITNVSHDIKTPLTSIVNYVDLLQKPHTEAEQVQYLEVLDRQSKRLKKLTENLVEASKASAGVLPVELAPTSVTELLNQAVAEYRERLENGKLETVLDLRGDLTVMADGKHMWRIMDNLLNNVVKYAMPGTRVYVTAAKQNGRVLIAVKNISRDPLNMDSEELMERFVRGDSARHTEGSGLGLNIARSLTALQHGTFTLTVDGDFFKAEIGLQSVEQA